MLNDHDIEWLIGQIIGTAELLGHDIKPTAAAMLADDLSSYPRQVLASALSRVRTEHSGRLTPKVIIDRIDEAMGRPSANEAWSIAITALDERKTVVWTSEMSQAWGVAHPIAQQGDMVGARMAFIGAYERLVRTARDERRLPEVTVSLGSDASDRALAVERAVQLGYMPAAVAQQYQQHLPAPEAFSPGFNPVAMLTGRIEAAKDAPPEIKARLRQMRDEIASADQRRQAERSRQVVADAAELAVRKAEIQRRVDGYINAQGAA
jgi:hypothetical protein